MRWTNSERICRRWGRKETRYLWFGSTDLLRRVPAPHFRRPSRQKRLRRFLPLAKNQCHLEANLVLLDAVLLQAVLPQFLSSKDSQETVPQTCRAVAISTSEYQPWA